MADLKCVLFFALLFIVCIDVSFSYTAIGRGGAVAVLLANKIYIQGGYTGVYQGSSGPGDNDMLILPVDQGFNLTTPAWDPKSGPIPNSPALQGQVASIGGYNNSIIYFFGGQYANNSNDQDNNLLWAFDSVSGDWSQSQASGLLPQPVDSHSAVSRHSDSTIWIFGGEDRPANATSVFNTTWRLVTQPALSWSLVGGYAPGGGRQAHTANLLSDGRMIILGGENLTGYLFPMTNVLVFDTNSGLWTILNATLQGTSPVARLSHVSVTTYDDKILIHGGDGGDELPLGDIAILDMKAADLAWYIPQALGTAPTPRVAHNAVMVGTRAFILFGQTSNNTLDSQIYALDTITWTWLTTYTPDHLEYTVTWLFPSTPIPNITTYVTSSTTSPTTTPNSGTNSSTTIGESVGAVVAAVAVCALAILIGFIVYKRRRTKMAQTVAFRQKDYENTSLRSQSTQPIESIGTSQNLNSSYNDRILPVASTSTPPSPIASSSCTSNPPNPPPHILPFGAPMAMYYGEPNARYSYPPSGYPPVGYLPGYPPAGYPPTGYPPYSAYPQYNTGANQPIYMYGPPTSPNSDATFGTTNGTESNTQSDRHNVFPTVGPSIQHQQLINSESQRTSVDLGAHRLSIIGAGSVQSRTAEEDNIISDKESRQSALLQNKPDE